MNLLSFVDQSMEGTPYWNLRNMLFFLIPATGLVLTFMRHLSNLEHIRQIELRRINEELERKVAELEQFTYTVSHELKNPVVTIKAFLGSVEEDIKRGNLEKARMDFQRISRATDNLHNTLSDLLELSRVGRIVNTFEEFPMAELVQEAIGVVEGRIRSREAVITLAPSLPNVYGDRKRLQEVIENLLDNAIKYTGSQEQPSIEVGMRDGKDATFFVKDNGIGIEPQYRQKIFGLFEKLDSTSEGTGVGLAFIKRIIETHDGKIWVESEGAGKGSTFCFTIPDNRNQ
jgi:signal transduction histidine kinase